MEEGSGTIKTVLISLRNLYDKAIDEDSIDKLETALCEFKCSYDSDIEQFLHSKALNFIQRRWCSVYLLVDEEAFENGKVKIEAYFTLSHKAMGVTENISRTQVQRISGAKQSEALHFVLIGQLGKHIDTENQISSDVSRTDILNEAYGIIYMSSEHIPCRCVLIECND